MECELDQVKLAPLRRRVAIAGTFDVANYGDLLFPLIAKRRLEPAGYSINAYSPTETFSGFIDAIPAQRLMSLSAAAAETTSVMIGGGNIIHNRPVRLPDYAGGTLPDTAYASLWLLPTLIAAYSDMPVVWNAPGVPAEFSHTDLRDFVGPAILAASYATVRDEASRLFLGRAGEALAITPDTAFEVDQLWDTRDLDCAWAKVLERYAVPASSRTVAIHVKERALSDGYERLANQLSDFASTQGLYPLLIGLAPCHGDHIAVRRLSRFLTVPHAAIDDTRQLVEIASVIAKSELFIGPSLHGFITSASFRRRGVLLAHPDLPKFSAIGDMLDRRSDVVPSWMNAFDRGVEQLKMADAPTLPDGIQTRLDLHWNLVQAAIQTGTQDRPRRMAFLRRFAQHLVTSGSHSDILQPFTQRRGPTILGRPDR